MKEYVLQQERDAEIIETMNNLLAPFIGSRNDNHTRMMVEASVNQMFQGFTCEGLAPHPSPRVIATWNERNRSLGLAIYDQNATPQELYQAMRFCNYDMIQDLLRAYPEHSGWLNQAWQRYVALDHLSESLEDLRAAGIPVPIQ